MIIAIALVFVMKIITKMMVIVIFLVMVIV